jgi:hypothetical protein
LAVVNLRDPFLRWASSIVGLAYVLALFM